MAMTTSLYAGLHGMFIVIWLVHGNLHGKKSWSSKSGLCDGTEIFTKPQMILSIKPVSVGTVAYIES
jgi:hypothetical protein